MREALDNYVIRGLTHNVPLCHEVLRHPKFVEGVVRFSDLYKISKRRSLAFYVVAWLILRCIHSLSYCPALFQETSRLLFWLKSTLTVFVASNCRPPNTTSFRRSYVLFMQSSNILCVNFLTRQGVARTSHVTKFFEIVFCAMRGKKSVLCLFDTLGLIFFVSSILSS